jgi:acyl-CoA synthetase (AMP-forming)/AMP-acid ligase II
MLRRIGLVEGHPGADFRAPGVLATGDVFTRDEEGYLFYKGRLAEYVLRGGEKIALATVRRVATQIPGVVAARTRVSPGEGGEDFDLMLIVGKASELQTPDQYRATLARSLRRSELPRTIEVVAETPVQAFSYK